MHHPQGSYSSDRPWLSAQHATDELVAEPRPRSQAPRQAPDRVVQMPVAAAPAPTGERACVRGKFIYRGDRKLHLCGVTYGPFGSDADEYPSAALVRRDFAAMAATGINAVRTYTVPPRWLLDLAAEHGLLVMVGLPWEQHVAFLDDRELTRDIERRVVEAARSCAGHPALLALVIGNEIPAPIVRWHGRQAVESFLRRLYRKVKEVDPEALVTYVNYPSTEYLQLPFLDFVAFNVYLEQREELEAYLARLQNLTGDRPLVMAEVGLDSRRNGLDRQAEVLDWQIRAAFAAGAAGAFVFAWTDQWHRGGYDIDDWDFGLVDRNRAPKPALAAVHGAFAEVPLGAEGPWPSISVVVCSYNGAATIGETLAHASRLDYPDYELIVVDDGSTDRTIEIARRFDCQLIEIEHGGLAQARNAGAAAARGEIVAYLDDDAYPDRDWLRHLAHSFRTGDWAAVGGPNIPPPGGGWLAQTVAHAPGGPIHVLIGDREAEHIPGCNLAVRRDCLEEVEGFDPTYTAAGDDVDFCWRLQECGRRLGFNPAAMVFHHRRGSFRDYWRQQRGYGRAEALLEAKWPERYNAAGHVSWGGRLYGAGAPQPGPARRRWRIYHGIWGTAGFQSLYDRRPSELAHLPLMPEWFLLLGFLAGLSLLSLVWAPLLLALPLLVVGTALVVAEAIGGSRSITATGTMRPWRERAGLRVLTFVAFLIQPAARLWGRASTGLTPWRRSGDLRVLSPPRRRWEVWCEEWTAPQQWLAVIEARARLRRVPVARGGPFDDWDLETRGGLLGAVRLRMAIEEHGAGMQLARFAISIRISRLALWAFITSAAIAAIAALGGSWIAAGALALFALWVALRTLSELAVAFGGLQGRGELPLPERIAAKHRRRAEDALSEIN